MMAVQLKDTLRCLCVEIGWSYAVFWKVVRRHNQMHLVWEDGHCERPPDARSMEFKAIDLLQNSRGGLFAELGCQELGSLAYKMMSTQVHVVGDGIVGQAALTGNHRWILWDAHNDYGSVPKGLAEMNHQFSAGIQTIAIIPVLPHGVVQLGSTQMVMENMEFIHHLRSRFAQLTCVPQALDSRSLSQPCSLISQLYGNMPVNSSTTTMMPTIHPVLEPTLHHHRHLESESVGALVVSSSREVRATENASSQNIKGIYNFDPLQGLDKRTSPDPVWSTSGNDLSDLLGPSNKSGCYDANAHELSADFSTCLTHLDMGPFFDALNDEIYSNPDQLLDAVVAQINASGKDDNVSCKTSLTNISSSIHTSSATCGWVGSVEQMHGECVDLSPMLVKPEAACSSSVISACSMDKTGECPQRDPGYKSQISSWVENGQSVSNDSISATHGKGMDEVGKLNRKRARPGHNPRPRPKDRQMIQDRVKELREIVPNGAKCSIDTLLEKTIKHMLFLQSVTKHADKLKEVGEPKIVSKEGGLLLKDNFEGGATWAFEVGTQSMICPIIVEDLNLPRQMVVEMLCEQQDLFLEIADLIRGLGLTILKGVMEARNSKVWARFAVEANRDVTRMEIFLSLVRLLEPNAGSNMMPQGAENLNIPQHNMLHPSSIPATGLADCLR